MRLDVFLFENGLAKSRSYAKSLIENGNVTVNGKIQKKPSLDVTDTDMVKVTAELYEYVSRGGVKLEGALQSFQVDVSGMVCVDIGASSGGFTDCLLQNGASRVYAIDSGSGQLAESLRKDSRVVNIENFNARNLCGDDLPELCDIAVTDVSFISQTLIIPAAVSVLDENGIYISLIKPQFECGRAGLGKGGIVKSKKVIFEAVKKVISCAADNGLYCKGLIRSPIKGGDGNTEFLMLCSKQGIAVVDDNFIKETVGV